VAGLPPTTLAGRIIDALLVGKPATDPLPPAYAPRSQSVVSLLVANDRPDEQAALGPLWALFGSLPATAPTKAQWTELAVDLLLAEFAGISGRWAVTAAATADLATAPAAERAALETLAPFLSRDLDRAIALNKQLPGTEQEFRKLADALAKIRAEAVKWYPKVAGAFDTMQALLKPLIPGEAH
jgi:hypothetical protein